MKVSSGVKFKVIIALILAFAVTFSAALWSAFRPNGNTALAETDSAAIARKLNGVANDWKTETVVTVGDEASANGAVITIDENKASVTAITIPSGARVTVNGLEPSVQRELENTAVYSQLVFDVPVTVKAESVLTFNADVVFRAGVTVEGTLIINGMAFNQNGTMLVSNAANNYAEIRSEGVIVNGALNNDGARGGQITVSEGATLSITPSTTSSYIENGQRKEFPNYDGGALFLKAGESGASGLSVSGSLKNEGSVICDSTISAAPVTNGTTVVSAAYISSIENVSGTAVLYPNADDSVYASGTAFTLQNASARSWNGVTLLSFGRTTLVNTSQSAYYNLTNVNLGGGASGSDTFTQGANELIFDGGAKWTENTSGGFTSGAKTSFLLGDNTEQSSVYTTSFSSSSPLITVGGSYYSTSVLNVYGGVSIVRNAVSGSNVRGGGISLSNYSDLNLYGGKIAYNANLSIRQDGGGAGIIGNGNDISINIYGGAVTRNALTSFNSGESSADGAGISLESGNFSQNTVLSLYGGEISYNHGSDGLGSTVSAAAQAADGGGVRIHTGIFNLYGGAVSHNFTGGFGGGVIMWLSELNMTGGEISGNYAAFGGGVAMTSNTKSSSTGDSDYTSEASISGGKVTGNVAATRNTTQNNSTKIGGYGGGICVGAQGYYFGSKVALSGNVEISANRAIYGGGLAVYANNGTDGGWYPSYSNSNYLEMNGGTITGNIADSAENGSGAYVSCVDGNGNVGSGSIRRSLLLLSGNASIDSSNNVSFAISTSSSTAPIQVTGELTGSGLAALVRLPSESSWSGKSIVSYASSDDIDRNKFLLDSTQYSFYENGNALSIHSVSTSTDYVAEVYDGTNTSLQGSYTSLEEAVSAAADGQMIRVLRSATIASPITINGKNITIVPQEGVDITVGVASGFQLSADTRALFTVNGGSLTIGGSTSGKIAFDGNKSSGADMSLVYVSSGSFTLEADATLRNNSSSGNAGAVFLGENTSATIRGTIADTSGQFGAIYVSDRATLNVDGATVSGGCVNEKGENYAVYAIGENSKVILGGTVNFGGSEAGAVPYDGNAVYTENRITLADDFRNGGALPVGVTFPAARTAGTTIIEVPQSFVNAWVKTAGYSSAVDYVHKMFAVANMDADYMLIVSNADTTVANALVVSKSVVFVFDFTYTDGYDADSSQNGSVTFPGDLEKLLNDYTPAISEEQLGRIHTRGNLVVLELQSGSNFPLAAFSGYAAWEGYSLIRWEVNGTDTSYDYNGNIAYLDSEQEVSVRSVWVSNTYHFTFDTNRVTGSNTSGFQGFGGVMDQQTVDYDDADKSLHANKYTLVGWRFTGWNTLAGGNGTGIGDGETPDLTKIATGTPTYTTGVGEDGKVRITGAEYNITLYAQWSPIFSGAGVGTAASPFVLKTVNDLYVLEATVNGTEKGTDQSADCAALIGYKNSNAADGSADYTAEDYSGYYFKLDGAFDNASAPFTGVIGRVSTSPVAGGAHENDDAENYLDQEDQISRAIYGEVSATAGGTGVAAGTPFKGTFDGNGRTVQLNINKQAVEGGNGTVAGDETLVGAGMFGYTDHATIRNLTLSGTVHGYAHVGGLVGYAFGGTISDIYNGAKITSGGHDVGGVIGTFFELTGNYAQSSVTNAANAGEISYQPREGEDKTYRLDIDSDWNELEVMPDAVGVRFGGIVGAGITLRLTGGYNLGSVTARYGAGGVVGTLRSMSNSISDDAVIAQSFNAGAVTATAGLYASYTLGSGYKQNFITAYTGGITGRLVGVSSVSYSYNSGDVRATFAAKIVSADGTVSNEDDYVYLTSTENAEAGTYLGARGVGGIVGFTSFDVTAATQNGRMAISNVYNTGDITSWAGVGGIAGYLAYSNITNSFNGGNVTATGFHFDAGGTRYAGGYMLTAGSNTVYTAYLGAIVGRGVSASLDATVSYNINAAYTGLTDATVQAIGDSNYNAQFGLDQNITSAIGLTSSQMRVDANGSAPSGFVSTFNSTGWSFYHYVGETAESGSVTYSYYPQISAFANGEGTSENLVGGTPVDLAKYSKDSAQIKYRVSSEEGEEDTPVTDETTFRLTFVLNGGEFGFSADGEDSEGHIYHIFADKNKHYYEAGSGNWYYVFGYPVDKVDYVSEEGQAVGAGVLEQPDAPSRVGYTFAGWYVDSGYTEAFSFGAIPGQHTTVYAKWEPIVYTITYENVVGVGGTWVGDYNKTFDIQTSGKVTLPTDVNLERRGYVFSGWKYSGVDGYITQYSISAGNSPSILLQDAGGMNKATVPFSALTAGTLVLTAEWTAEPYSIQYRTEPEDGFADGQSATLHDAVTSYTVSSADFTLPTPQKTGYTFLRWILVSIDGNTDSVSDTINAEHYAIGGAVERIRSNTVGDFVLQAKWERNDITVYLDARGGAIEEYTSLGLQYDGTTGLYYTTVPYYDTLAALLFDGSGWKIKTVGLTGNTFNGWYTNSTATAETVVTSVTRVTVGSGSWTLYAGYETAKYTLTIDIQGNLPEGVTATIPADAQNSLQELGFTFDGGIGLSVFHGDDASSALAELVRAVLIEGETSYYFSSWTISPSGKSIYNVTDHLSLSAHYEENRVTVNFVGRNGEFLAGISVAVNGTISGDPEAHQDYLDLLNDQRLTKVFGYTFDNAWTYSDGEFSVDTTLITGAMVVYASFTPWKVNPAFTFAGDNTAITIDDMTYSFGSAFGTLPTMDELRAAYAEQQGSGDYLGYQIDGFYLDAERTKAVNINTLITADMWQQSELTGPLALTLYVKISKITYNITFNADGGTFADHGGESTYSGSYQYGETGSVIGFSLPTRVGYTLSQWYVSGVNGVSIGYIPAEEGADYAQELIGLLEGKYAGALNVIAIWEADVYSVWFYAGEDGYFTVPATIPEGVIFCNDADATPVTEAGAKASYCIVGVEYGKVPSIPASVAAKKEGYTFNGWLTSEGQIITAVRAEDTYSSASPITAQWSVSSYTIVFITNGGTSVADKSGVPYGANLNEQLSGITTTRTGYIFRGWFTDSGFQTSYPATMPASSLVLYAKWEIVTSALTLTITIQNDTGSGVEGAETAITEAVKNALGGVTANVTATGGGGYRVTVNGVEYGTSLSALNSLSVTVGEKAYTLNGLWISGGVSQPLGTMPDHNYEASASLTYKTTGHTVEFRLNDGTETVYYTLSGVTSVDASLENILKPTREGYEFAGWYDAEEDGNAFTFGLTLSGDTVLYAHWTVHEWTITLDLRGGSGTTSVAGVEYGTALWTGNGWNTILPEPLRGGYVFNGWYIDSSCTESAENTVMPDSDLTLYAGWTAVKYQLIFEYYSKIQTFEAEIGTAIEYPDSSETDKKYYRFTGWLISGGAHDKQAFSYSAMPDLAALDGTEENGVVRLTVIAQYEAIEYSAEYRDEDGAVLGNLTVSADMASEDTAGEENDLLTPLTEKDGYTFVGWRVVYADSSPSDTIYKKYLVTADGMKLVSADGTPSERIPFENVQNIDFYAVYAANTYTVTFESNGGTLQEEEKTKAVEYGSAYGTLPVSVRVGYTFLGWFTAQENGTQITADTAVSDHSDHALYAHWRANTYTVIFIGNGASGSMNPQKVTYGTPVSLTTNAFEREGYSFAVWNTQANGGGKTYGDGYNTSAGDLTSADNDIVILYAQWTDITFTVKFAGGEGATGSMNDQKFVLGTQATLNLNTFVKVGYDFGGWRLDDDTTFGDGDEFTILDNEIPENGVITLTAQWTVKTYTILFDEKDGVPLDDAASVAFTSSVTLPTATREGYAFLGWSTSDNDGNDGNVVYAGGAQVPVSLLFTGLEGEDARERTLYAVWKINSYTVTLNGTNVALQGESESYTVEHGAAYTLTLTAAEGYELPEAVSYTMGGGEKRTAQVSGDTVTIASVSGDLVIEAAGVAIEYTVTVSAGDGGVFTALPEGANGTEGADGSWTQFTVSLAYGSDVTAILNALEVKVNSAYHHLSEWTYHYLSEWNGEGKLEFLTGELTVTAQYAATEGAIVVTVVHPDGKTYTLNATYGAVLSESEAFTYTATGYTYNGWYYSDGEKTETFELGITKITRPVTVYPNATADKYNVTTESSNVDFVGGGDKVAAYGQSYTVTYLPALGYELSDLSVTMNGQPLAVGDYSYDAATGRLTIDRITGAIEISATVSAKDYTVTFDPNGGELTGNTTQSVTFGDKIDAPATPTKEGYTFIGWTYNGTAWDFENGTMPASDITLVASWKIKVYTVTFIADGTVQSEAEYLHGAKVTQPVDPVKDGYTFLGWYAEGSETAYVFADALTGELTLTAEWSAIKYTITYILSGGTNGDNPTAYTVETDTITLNASSRTGYTFAGWFDADENGSQITAVAGGKTGNITLYARWTANTYTVVFDANGGENAMDSLALTYDVAAQLTKCTLTRNGYTFAGWATEKNGAVAYLNGATVINLASENGTEVHLYAVWTANSYTVTFESDGGTSVTGQTVAYDEKVSEPAQPTKEGYTFAGWFHNGEAWNFESNTMPAEAITLTAQWTVNEYTVTFDSNGGELTGSATQSVPFGGKITAPAQPTKEGYTFVEWTYNGTAWNFESGTMPAGNVTLVAKWTANSYKIVFHANDGSETTKEQSVTYDEKTALEDNTFTRNGYTFAGWATEENGAVAYLNGATVINLASESGAEVHLYAVWTANSYTVTFDGNAGTVQGIGSKQVTFGSAYGTLPTATRTGYTFLGWFTAQTDGTRVTDVSVVNTATAHTLYAQWKAIEYTITYYDTDGADGTETQTFTYADEDFSGAVLNSYSRDGYTFNGWATSEGGYVAYADKALLSTLALPTDGKEVHLYAVWTANNYTVTFDSDGGTAVTGQTVAYGGKVSEPAHPTKEGHTFLGWTYNGETWTFESDTMPAENIELVAQWKVNEYTVTFDPNGGELAGSGTQSVPFGEQITEPAQPTKEGYTFAEWTYNGAAWDFESDTVPAGNITLVAKWTANSYKIVFHANDGSETTKEQSVTYDEKTALEDNTFTRNGYTFAGWATEENGAVAYLNGATVINLASESGAEVHLYAVWTANSYTVTFDGNAGTVQGIGSKQVTFGSAYGTLPTATRTGYTFLGWFTAQTDGTRVTDVSVVNTATAHTLYAQWKAIEYTITYYDTDGADGTETQTFTYADEDFASAVLNSYSRDGYTFSGWATSKDGYVAYADKALLSTLALPTDGDKIALYAVWQINSYTVTVNLTMPDSTDATTLNAVRGYIANALSKWSVSIAESGTSLTVTVSDLVYGTSLADLSKLFRTEETYSQITVNDALYLFVWTSAPADSLGAGNADYAGGWTNDEVKTVTVSVDGENKMYYLTEKDGKYTFDLGTLAEPAKYGAVFGGWQSSDGNIEGDILTVTGENATVTPVWKTISYTVQYGGDTVSTADLVFTWDGTDFMLGGEGGIAELAGGLTRAGYTFAGWKYEELTVFTLEELFANTALGNAGGMQESVTIPLVAVWTENVYIVQFVGNGATGAMNAQTFVFGTQGTLNPNTFVYVGYDFGGWMWQGKTYQDGQEFTVTEEVLPDEGTVITLTAEWTKKTYTVAYDENGGDTLEDATVAFTASVTLPAATREGYTFLGWATENDGNVVYAGGANVPVSLLFTGLEGTGEREKTLYAVWKINAYTVTLSGVNVILSGAETVGHGSDYTVSLTAVEGYGIPGTISYTMGGERQTVEVSGDKATISSVTGDLVIMAEGVADMHLVTVSAGGGGVFIALPDDANGTEGTDGSWTQFTVSLAYGTDVYTTVLNQIRMNVTGAPYQTLYDWTVTAGEKEWLFALGGDLTIVAQYAQEKVSVSIVLPDGTVRSEEVTYAQELDLNGLGIEVEGYTISGWRKGDEPIEGGKLVITAPVAIYAVATANTYEVTLNYGNGQETITVTFGKAFAYADGWTERPVRDGYTFLGWKHGENTISGNQIVGVLGEGYTLVAEWSVNSYTVTFHANGGQLKDKETITVVFGESISVPNAPEREGYTFEGWYYDLVKWDFEKDTMPSRDISLVANWIQNVYKVTFVNDSEISEAQYSHGSTVTQPPVPVKNGYTFLGWYTEGSETAYDFTALVTGDLKLTAEWSAIKYAITYVLNGGANGDNPTDYTIETDMITLNAPSRTGYNFLGWYNAEVGGAKVTEIAKGSTGNLTLHAIWEAKEYTVSFDSNGGTSVAGQTIAHGGKATQPPVPVKDGYTFLGWYTEGSKTAYDFAALVTGDLKLTAEWSAIEYTITYVLNGGANGDNPTDYTIETDMITLNAPSRTGYNFLGWYNSEVDGTKVTEIAKGSTGNLTLHAIWEAKEYTVSFVANGGNLAEGAASQTVAHGGKVAYTETQRENYLFLGWFTDEALTQRYDFNTEVTGDFTLYAKWRLQIVTGTADDGTTVMVSSDAGFDDGTTLQFVRVTEESTISLAGEALAENMTLARLYDIELIGADGNAVSVTQPISVGIGVDDLGEAEGRFSIAYIPEEGMAEELATHIGEDGKLYFFVEHFSHYAVVDITPVVAVPGFAWWWILVVIGGCAVIVLIGLLLARYRRVYELNYVNGGIAPQKLRESSLIDLPLPEREDEVFDGWYYDEEFRDRALLTTMPKQNLILFAKWRRMTDEERIVRDRKRAEAAAAAAEGFHHAEPPKEELHKEEPPREIEEDE